MELSSETNPPEPVKNEQLNRCYKKPMRLIPDDQMDYK